MNALLDKLVAWWLKRCRHAPEYVLADAAEGSAGDNLEIKWCRRCGAMRFAYNGGATHTFWRSPEPTWHPEPRP